MSQLPDKPSELIRVALADLEKCEASPEYVIDMGSWHVDVDGMAPDGPRKAKPTAICAVCLAGSVMAQSLGVPPSIDVEPEDFRGLERKLRAIDKLRVGFVYEALDYLGFDQRYDFDREVSPYNNDSAAFKRDMLALAGDLEGAGL